MYIFVSILDIMLHLSIYQVQTTYVCATQYISTLSISTCTEINTYRSLSSKFPQNKK